MADSKFKQSRNISVCKLKTWLRTEKMFDGLKKGDKLLMRIERDLRMCYNSYNHFKLTWKRQRILFDGRNLPPLILLENVENVMTVNPVRRATLSCSQRPMKRLNSVRSRRHLYIDIEFLRKILKKCLGNFRFGIFIGKSCKLSCLCPG